LARVCASVHPPACDAAERPEVGRLVPCVRGEYRVRGRAATCLSKFLGATCGFWRASPDNVWSWWRGVRLVRCWVLMVGAHPLPIRQAGRDVGHWTGSGVLGAPTFVDVTHVSPSALPVSLRAFPLRPDTSVGLSVGRRTTYRGIPDRGSLLRFLCFSTRAHGGFRGADSAFGGWHVVL
jgi:hypothetical protein